MMKQRKGAKRIQLLNTIVLMMVTTLLASGCAAKFGATKSLPPTAYPPATPVQLSDRMKKILIAIEPFEIEQTMQMS